MAAPYRLIFLRVVLVVVGAVAGLFVGFKLGETSFRLVAGVLDRHLFDPKEMILALAFSGAALGCAGAIWLSLVITRASRGWQRGGLVLFSFATLGAIALIASAFHWPLSSGPPQVQYELRLPPGAPTPRLNEIDVTIWSGRNGHGAFIERIERNGDRTEIAGDFTILLDNLSPMMSLRLRGGAGLAEGYWQLPYRPDSPLDSAFGPWQRITFTPSARSDVTALPPGDYEIRYRVRRYMRTY
jgi:hypothetical protein